MSHRSSAPGSAPSRSRLPRCSFHPVPGESSDGDAPSPIPLRRESPAARCRRTTANSVKQPQVVRHAAKQSHARKACTSSNGCAPPTGPRRRTRRAGKNRSVACAARSCAVVQRGGRSCCLVRTSSTARLPVPTPSTNVGRADIGNPYGPAHAQPGPSRESALQNRLHVGNQGLSRVQAARSENSDIAPARAARARPHESNARPPTSMDLPACCDCTAAVRRSREKKLASVCCAITCSSIVEAQRILCSQQRVQVAPRQLNSPVIGAEPEPPVRPDARVHVRVAAVRGVEHVPHRAAGQFDRRRNAGRVDVGLRGPAVRATRRTAGPGMNA